MDPQDKPIPGPPPVDPEYPLEPDMMRPVSPMLAVGRFFLDFVREPVHWFRHNVVEPNKGPKYYYYHRRFPRALPIDECYQDDYACQFEADVEYRRNFMVDRATLELLKERMDNCHYYFTTKEGQLAPGDQCKDLVDTYRREEVNFHIKYGGMKHDSSVIHAYNRQKHRMIVERRRAILAAKGELPEKLPIRKKWHPLANEL